MNNPEIMDKVRLASGSSWAAKTVISTDALRAICQHTAHLDAGARTIGQCCRDAIAAGGTLDPRVMLAFLETENLIPKEANNGTEETATPAS